MIPRTCTEQFLDACNGGDLDHLIAVLHPQVWGVAEFIAASLPTQRVDGPQRVSANLVQYYGPGTHLVSLPTADAPTLLAFSRRRAYAVLTLTLRDGRVHTINAVVDPSVLYPRSTRVPSIDPRLS